MLTLKELQVAGQRTLLRVDFNVPCENGKITDDTKIQKTLPTLRYLIDQKARIILMSHLGRPKQRDEKYSLKPIKNHLERLLGKKVGYSEDAIGEQAERMASDLLPGEVLLLENLRFYKGEEDPKQHPDFTLNLAKLGDCYVDDAFGAMHREHASVYFLPLRFPGKAALGFLAEKELSFLEEIANHPKPPFYLLVGGAKVSTKLGILKPLLKKSQAIFLGGALSYTFLKAQGIEIGNSLVEPQLLEEAAAFLKAAKNAKVEILLPKDHIIAKNIDDPKDIRVTEGIDIPEGFAGFDIGPKTVKLFKENMQGGRTFFWNGPFGAFEKKPFDQGTKEVIEALLTIEAIKIAGGGDSIAALNEMHLERAFTHISTGGGASLEFFENGTLPGIQAIEEADALKSGLTLKGFVA